MSEPDIAPIDLASMLAARLCHDFINPAGSIVNGLDLLAGSPAGDVAGAAMEMIDGGARRLLALIAFSRVAFGAGEEMFGKDSLEALARGVFIDARPTLEWSVEIPALGGAAARTLLGLVRIAADSLALGGVARARAASRGGAVDLRLDALDPRAKLHPEVLRGIGGEARGEGLSGRWAPAYFVHALVARASGAVTVEVNADGIAFTATLPESAA
jgi:histidine phosphotransferase ChpT